MEPVAQVICTCDDCDNCPYPDCIKNDAEARREYSRAYYQKHREQLLLKQQARNEKIRMENERYKAEWCRLHAQEQIERGRANLRRILEG